MRHRKRRRGSRGSDAAMEEESPTKKQNVGDEMPEVRTPNELGKRVRMVPPHPN